MKTVVLILLSFLLGVAAQAQEADAIPSNQDWLKAVTSDDLTMLYKVIKQKENSEAELSGKIIKFISQTDDNLKKSKGFFVLGKISSLSSVSFLLKNLDFCYQSGALLTEMPLIGTYPAQDALVKMGPKVLSRVLDAMIEEKDLKNIPPYLNVAFNICSFGVDYQNKVKIFEIIVQDHINQIKDGKTREQFQKEMAAFIDAKLKIVTDPKPVPKFKMPEVLSKLWDEPAKK